MEALEFDRIPCEAWWWQDRDEIGFIGLPCDKHLHSVDRRGWRVEWDALFDCSAILGERVGQLFVQCNRVSSSSVQRRWREADGYWRLSLCFLQSDRMVPQVSPGRLCTPLSAWQMSRTHFMSEGNVVRTNAIGAFSALSAYLRATLMPVLFLAHILAICWHCRGA